MTNDAVVARYNGNSATFNDKCVATFNGAIKQYDYSEL